MSESYFLFSSGELRRKDQVVRLTTPDGRFKDLKIELTRDIYLFGEVNLNTKCLNYLAEKSVPVHLFNYYGYYTGSFYPRERNVSGNLVVEQVVHYQDKEKRLTIAKKIIEAAVHNICRTIRYYQQRGKEFGHILEGIQTLQRQIPIVHDVPELMGIEGNIRKLYYLAWPIIINQQIDFEKRKKRPPDNMINALISYGNTFLYTVCLSELYVTQLNPTISYLHSTSERRFSLSLDLAEVFKPLLVDRLIFSLLNKNILTEKDFEKESNFCYMKQEAQQKFLRAFQERLEATIKHRELQRNISYRRLIRLEGYKIIKHLMSDKEYEGFKIWW